MSLELQIKGNKIFAPLKDKWLVLTPEEKVRQTYICRLVNHYGYSLDQMQQEVTVAEGNKRGTGRASADIVIWKNKDEVEKKAPSIVVECKADNIDIVEGDYFEGSGRNPIVISSKTAKEFKLKLKSNFGMQLRFQHLICGLLSARIASFLIILFTINNHHLIIILNILKVLSKVSLICVLS